MKSGQAEYGAWVLQVAGVGPLKFWRDRTSVHYAPTIRDALIKATADLLPTPNLKLATYVNISQEVGHTREGESFHAHVAFIPWSIAVLLTLEDLSRYPIICAGWFERRIGILHTWIQASRPVFGVELEKLKAEFKTRQLPSGIRFRTEPFERSHLIG